jgi:hypothetical protein
MEQKQDAKILQTQYINSGSMQNTESKEKEEEGLKKQPSRRNSNLNNACSVPTISFNYETGKENKNSEPSFDPLHSKTSVNIRSESEQLGWNSQKEIGDSLSNPEKKGAEKKVENIMDIEDMGFKKNKQVKIKEE